MVPESEVTYVLQQQRTHLYSHAGEGSGGVIDGDEGRAGVADLQGAQQLRSPLGVYVMGTEKGTR